MGVFTRTHYCGKVSETSLENEVVLCGWVDRWRDHGGVIFIDLRDQEGVVQIVFDPSETVCSSALVEQASKLRNEYVVGVKGKVRHRPAGMENPKLTSGKIEVLIHTMEVFSEAAPLPYSMHEDSPSMGTVDETLRLKHRYLELRRPQLQRNLRIRHQFLKSVREFYASEGFTEVETPLLYKSTPEGARDYLVPSRVQPGNFYALPQSPQTLKQLCMIGGIDRYFQIARCFRDEDLRADRQPEFTQIDVEMAFVEAENVFELHERMLQKVFADVLEESISAPFQRLPYSEVMRRYGTDKPDVRISLELVELSEQGEKSDFNVFKTVLKKGGILKGLCFEEKEVLTRKDLDGLPKQVAPFGAKGVAWIRIKAPGDWQSPLAKFFSDDLKKEIEAKLPAPSPCLLLLVCDTPKVVNGALGYLRVHFGEKLGFKSSEKYNFLWVEDFPLFEYDAAEGRLYAAHHPFTRPHPEDRELFLNAKSAQEFVGVKACAYDLVINGYEAGGGSLRIYRPEEQAQMFHALGLSPEEANEKFGFFLGALKYGTPPHGGIALGVDRIAMILSGTNAIRDVIAFPKTQKAACLMSEAPSRVAPEQLQELFLELVQTDSD